MKNPVPSRPATHIGWSGKNRHIDRREFHTAMGYPSEGPKAGMEEMIERVCETISTISQIQAGYRLLSIDQIDSKSGQIKAEGVILKPEKIITGQLKKAEILILFTCTIGPEPERWAKQLMDEGEPVLSYMADTGASVLTEQTAEELHNMIEKDMSARGLGVTNRFSPGYCGWDVAEQFKLFQLLPKNFCGINLEGSAFMNPRKSVSGIIGAGKRAERKDYTCNICKNEHCIYRLKQNG